MRITVHKLLCCLLWLSVLPAVSQSASFDCGKAKHPIEQAICQSHELSHVDEELAGQYGQLLVQCTGPAQEDMRNDQRRWVADVRRRFTTGATDWLMEQYQERRAALAEESANCTVAVPEAGGARIRSMRVDSNLVLPFVETSPPEMGRAITQHLFTELLQASAPKKYGNGRMEIPHEERMGMYVVNYRVVRNQGPLLILEIHSGGCGSSCSEGKGQYMFDLRTGRAVRTEDLFTDASYASLLPRLKNYRVRQAGTILEKLRKRKGEEPETLEVYESCLREWKEWEPHLWPISLDAQGRWHFSGGGCYGDKGFPAFESIEVVMTMDELYLLLGDYGRSLLMNEGDVLRPDVETLNCPAESALPAPAARGPQAIKDVVRGDGYVLLLRNSGELLSWGHNSSGALGIGTTNETLAVATVGKDFVQIAAGLGFSAGLRRDGSLWTWGDNYAGKLGDGSRESRSRPVRIMDDVKLMALGAQSGIALKRDGTVWGWGGRLTGQRDQWHNDLYKLVPEQMAGGVTQIEYVPHEYALLLKNDGSLYVLDGTKRLIGSGFSRLAARGGELAFKRDGSLWAWGKTLASVFDTDGRLDHPPEKISDGVVRVNVSDDGQFVGPLIVALKRDGSLWASRQRGNLRRLSPIGCGFRDVTVTGNPGSNPGHSVYVLAIRRDGTLVAWGNWAMEKGLDIRAAEKMFASAPHALGKNFVRLYQVGPPGNLSLGAFIEHRDGSLWQWYPPRKDAPAEVKLIQKIWP